MAYDSGVDNIESVRIYAQLPASKTDPFRRGVNLTIAATDDDACALKSLQRLYVKFPASMYSPLFDTEGGFTRQFVTNVLRQKLSELGVEGNYSGHSFRRGAAIWASKNGLSEEDIMTLGRWKSDSYKLYIETDSNKAIIASRKLRRGSNFR